MKTTTIIVDTREQDPCLFIPFTENEYKHSFLGKIQVVRKALKTGDYSVAGYEDKIAVERKSISDLISTFRALRLHLSSKNDKRGEAFLNELERLKAIKYSCIAIEGTPEDLFFLKSYSQMSPYLFLCLITKISLKYCPVHFYGYRHLGTGWAWNWMINNRLTPSSLFDNRGRQCVGFVNSYEYLLLSFFSEAMKLLEKEVTDE